MRKLILTADIDDSVGDRPFVLKAGTPVNYLSEDIAGNVMAEAEDGSVSFLLSADEYKEAE